MAYKVFENGFAKGWNQDIDPRFQENSTYRDPVNVSVLADGKFYSCRNISGSKELETFLPATATDVNILGAFRAVGTYENYPGATQRNPSIIYFISYNTAPSIISEIQLYDIVNDKHVTLLSTKNTDVDDLAFPREGTIDACVFGENNIDKVYWEDHENVLRKIDVKDTVLSDAREVTAIPYAPIDPISYVTQENGSGQLASGTYQFGYRYFNIDNKKYTTWSLLTNPIPVYPLDYSDVERLDEIYGGVANEATRKSIILKVDKTVYNAGLYDSIQLCVIKNTNGLLTSPTVAYITAPIISPIIESQKIVYDGGGLESTLDISEIIGTDACVEAAKTLIAKDNVLFRGNLKYSDRVVDSVSYNEAKTITKQLGLEGTVYAPFSPNTSVGTIDFRGSLSGSNAGDSEPQWQTGFANDTEGGPFPPYPEVDRVKSLSFVGDQIDIYMHPAGEGPLNVNNRTSGSGVPDWCHERDTILEINNAVPGNVFAFSFRGYEAGLEEVPLVLFLANNDEMLFKNEVLNNIRRGHNKYESGPEGPVSSYGRLPDMHLMGYKYIVQPGDTDESVAKSIVTEVNASLDPEKMQLVYISGSRFKIDIRYPQIQNTYSGEDNGLGNVIYWVEPGTNITVADSNAELNDLINNENSVEGGYKNPLNVVNTRGYFRDEVYRFGITWQDKYGCWSQPVAFDFRSRMARDDNYDFPPNAVSDIVLNHITNVAKIKPLGNFTGAAELGVLGINRGDYVKIESLGLGGGVVYLHVAEIYYDGHLLVNWRRDDFPTSNFYNAFKDGNITVQATRGAEYSHAVSGTDWKFPNRENTEFPMMSTWDEDVNMYVDSTDGFIQPLGLKITGIKNHPEWAKAFAIVRVRRLKDIVWQSPVITTVAIMPSVFPPDETYCVSYDGSRVGAFGPKPLTKGIASNFERTGAEVVNTSKSKRVVQLKERNNELPIVYCVPPEYMMSQNGINFETVISPAGAEIKVVDAASLLRTPRLNVEGTGADDGSSPNHQMGFGLRADSPYNYYYRQHRFWYPQKKQIRRSMRNPIFSDGSPVSFPDKLISRVLDYGEMTNGGAQYTFPTNPAAYYFPFKRMDTFGINEASLSNCSNVVTHQKGLALLINDKFGDFTIISKSEFSSFTIPQTYLHFGIGPIGPQAGRKLNCDKTVYSGLNGQKITNSITELEHGASSIVPIANLVRGLSDDRYGDKKNVHQYIFTGTYVPLDEGVNAEYDVEVWGGDCFISKGSFKISNTTAGTNATSSYRDGYGIYTYPDHHEIVSLYLESRVNLGLQANPFIYPVRDTRSLGEFATDYGYPYNFSYSLENINRTWVSRSETESKRLEFPARIIHSRQKVYQSDIEGFDRYDATSIYDLEETYESLTKLTILSNGNVYAIQELAVSVIPINKNIIEQSDGNQMVVNRSVLINTPQFLLTENGSQHLRSVITSDSTIYFLDANKREAFRVGGGKDSSVTEMGLHSVFLDKFESFSGLKDVNIVSGYDFNNREYWIGFNNHTDVLIQSDDEVTTTTEIPRDAFMAVWSDKGNFWMTSIVLKNTTNILDLVFSKSEFYLLGKKEDNTYVIEELYTGDVKGKILGEVNPSEVSVVINADRNFGKSFDVLRIDSNERLDNVELTVEKEDGVVSQVALMNADVKPRHDGYEFPVLYDANGARLRGKYAIARLIMNNGDGKEINIVSLSTKYRLSARVFK